MANSGWDIVGLSEDFNYHSYIVGSPASTYYNFGKHSGSIPAELSSATSRAKVDGLGIAVAKHMSFTGDTGTGLQIKWEDEYGGGSGIGANGIGANGADNMITKGFRMYTVTIATGVAVDVYVLHMDASTADDSDDYNSDGKDRNVVARESQLTQLATYIKNNHNNRPVIILGDTNCRYTREQLKKGFIDVINADSRFTIEDPWVELMWGGTYPTYGAGSMMTDTYGMQKGEIVDKVFYINTTASNLKLKANSYLHDESVNISEHKPVVVNFTLTDPNGTAINKKDSWTLEEIEGSNSFWEGEQVVSGTTYYMMNVGTGEYIKWGGDRYTEAVAGDAGVTITPIQNGNTWALKSSDRSGGLYMGTGEYTYLDRPIGESTWTLEPIDGTEYQYRLKTAGGLYLSTTPSEVHKPIKAVAGNTNDDNQKWIFLTDDRIRTEMNKATAENPFNFTALLKSADFDAIEIEDGWANNWDGFDWSGGGTATLSGDGPFKGTITGWNQNNDHAAYSTYAYANTTSAVSMSQALGKLPNGTYMISFEGFYRAKYKKNWYSGTSEETVSATVQFGSAGSVAIKQNKSTNIGDDAAAHLLFKNDTYATSSTFTMDAQSITFSVNMPKTTGSSRQSGWICVDNFSLKYFGTGEVVNYDPYKDFKNTVARKVNETYEKVLLLNDAGQAAYDISAVIYRHENDLITTEAIANSLCDMVDEAYANACEAHKNYIVSQALTNMESNGGDITAAIINPSFETGDVFGWTIGSSGWDKGARLNSDAIFTTEGCDGEYLFNSYGGDDGHTGNIQQTINGIPNGLYELKAKLTSFNIGEVAWHQNDADNPHSHTEHYRIYLTGNGYHTSVAADKGKTVFHETTLYFLVEDHSATIGAVGGNKGPNATEFKYYWPREGCFFKADNFRLKYICDVPHGRLKLALDEANNATLDAFGKIALDISSYQTMYENKSLGSSDGKTEAAAVYTALQTAAKAQKTAGADMTWAITNPNFETGDYTGWTCETGGDTKAASQENITYTVAGADGRFLFNTWDGGTAQPLTQTVSGLANGTYKVTAMVASDPSQQITLTANEESARVATNTANSLAVYPEVTCTVSDGTLAIEVVGVNDIWYKCDDFHLTLVEPAETPELVFDHAATTITAIEDITFPRVVLQRPIKAKDSKGNPAWSSFVAPFDIPAFDGWDYMKLTGATYNAGTENLSLQFSKVATIEAGVPYMVRCTTLTETLPQIEMGETSVNTVTMKNTEVDIVNGNGSKLVFKGVYTAGNVPQGAFFISDNTFYQAGDDSNTIKGFRGYIEIEGSLVNEARSMSFRWDDGTTSIDDGQLTNDNEVTTVAIYNERGMRLTEMQQGINILLMSDGSVVKVMIK